MRQNLPWIHVPLYDTSFVFLFTKLAVLLLMQSPIVQTLFSKTTFQEEVITEKIIQLLVCRWWYFVFCFFSHLITMLRWGEKKIHTREDTFLSQLDRFQLLYTDSRLFNDHENNCLQWKTICFGLSDRGEMCLVSEVLPVLPRELKKASLDWKFTNLLM